MTIRTITEELVGSFGLGLALFEIMRPSSVPASGRGRSANAYGLVKMGGALLASRAAGESWRNGWALAALLNTRGLVELVVLNIALSADVFSPALFTMLVVMALATTAMTLPILNALQIGSARLPASC